MRCRHRHRLDLVVRDVDDRRLEPAVQLDELRARLRRAAWRRGSRAARPSGTPRDGARSPGRARPVGAARRRAGRACGRAARRGRGSAPLRRTSVRRSSALILRVAQRELDVPAHRHVRVERVALEHHRDVAVLGLDVVHDAVADADDARRSDPRARRSCAARSTCRSPTDRAARGTRGRRSRARGRRLRSTSPKRLRHAVEDDASHAGRRLRAEEPAAGVPSPQRRDSRRRVGGGSSAIVVARP